MFLFKGFGSAIRPLRFVNHGMFRFQSTRAAKPQGIKALMKEYGYPALAVYLVSLVLICQYVMFWFILWDKKRLRCMRIK